MGCNSHSQCQNFGDVANVNLTGTMSTIGFGSIDQTVNERNKFAERSYGVQTNVNLDKFLPQEAGIKFPMFFSFNESFKTHSSIH